MEDPDMPRVTALPATALSPAMAEVFDRVAAYGPFADQAAVLAHVPPAFDHLYRMLMELKARRAVPWRYIELGIVVASKLNACAYCVAGHSPNLQIEGLPAEAIAQLPNADHPAFDDTDRLVIDYATRVTQSAGRIPERVFEALRLHFSEAQIVELTLRVSLTGFFNRFNDALQIDDGAAALDHHPLDPATTETGHD
jgi:AhpD family alkylhydroperoxidase